MGYFSDLAQKYIDFDYDRSYPSPEEQLLWRLDDLNNKLEELTEKDAPYRGWERLTDNDIRYAIPEYFENTFFSFGQLMRHITAISARLSD